MSRVPWPLVVRPGGWTLLYGWLLALAGATAVLAGIAGRNAIAIAVGALAALLGILLIRRSVGRSFPAYRARRR